VKDRIEVSTIRRLKQQNKPDKLIEKELGLSPALYNKYKEKLQEQERKELENLILEDLAYELLEYVDSLRNTINTCKEISKNGSSLERLESERVLLFCHNELIRLMTNGPQILASVQVAPALKKAFRNIEKKGQEIVDVEVVEEKEKKEKRG
jgi:hypothetical protein